MARWSHSSSSAASCWRARSTAIFSAKRFARARIFRLFPAAISTIAIFALLFQGFGFNLYQEEDAQFTPLNIVSNMLMLHTDIDAVMWSMKAELAATPLIFLCVAISAPRGVAGHRDRLGLVRPVVCRPVPYRHAIGTDTNLTALYAFPVGILLHFKGAGLAKRFTPSGVTLAALASVSLFWACSYFKPDGMWTLLVECACAATLVMLVAYRVEAPLFAPLDLPIVRFYGRISYSFYLLHPPVNLADGSPHVVFVAAI